MKAKFIAFFTARATRVVLPLAVLVIGISLTFLNVRMQNTTYTANARIWIQTKYSAARSSDSASPIDSVDSPLTTGPNAIRTACEIISSDSVTKYAAELLKQKLGNKAPPASLLGGGLAARPVDNTDILDLKFTCNDPDLCVLALQAIMEAFYHENALQVAGPLQESKDKLEKQLKLAKEQYSKSKNKFKQFQDDTSSIDLMADVSSLNTEKGSLETAISETKHELISANSKLEYSKKQLGFGPEDVVAVEKLSNDPIMGGLRQSIADTEVQLISLRSKFQDEHPKVKRLKATLEEAKKEMDARYNSLIGRPDLRESFIAAATDEAQKKLLQDMAEASTSIAALGPKLSSLNTSLSRVKGKLSQVPRQQVVLADLHRADELATNSLTAIERELQRVHLTETVATANTNMQVIDEAQLAGSSTPNMWMLGIGISFGLAVGLAFLQFVLCPKRIGAGQLALLMPFRTAGFVPLLDKQSDSTSLLASVDRLRISLSDWFLQGSLPIVVTSPEKGDGKSTVAYALAVCLAESGKKVLVIDADNASPTIHRMAAISASPGLLQYLLDPAVNHLSIMQAVRENLTVIPAGGIADSARSLKQPRFTLLVEELARHFDAVIIDSSEAGLSLNSLITPQFACRWLAVVKMGVTLQSAVQNLGTQLELLPSLESAVVANGVRQKDIHPLRQSAPSVMSFPPAGGGVRSEAAPTPTAPAPVENETALW